MAALTNVLVVVSSITVGGVVYVLATDNAVVGDIIRFNLPDDDTYDEITNGGYYTVTHVDSGDDPHIQDDDGDDFDTVGDDFTVFKRSTTLASPTTVRRLTVGDYAKIVANIEDHDYEIGSVVKIITDDHDSKPYIGEYKNGCTGNYFMTGDAVMATQAEFDGVEPANSQQHVHEGVTYSKVARLAIVGDLVVAIKKQTDITAGSVYTVTEVDYLGITVVDDVGDANGLLCDVGTDYLVLEPATETRVHEGITYNVVNRIVKTGDKLVVITKPSNWKTVGRIYQIVNRDSDGEPVVVDNDGDETHIANGRYAVLEPVEITPTVDDIIVHDGKTYRKVSRKAAKDDLVVITEATGHFIKVGEIVVARSSDVFFAKREQFHDERSSDDTQWITADAYRVLEPITVPTPQYREVSRNANVGERIKIVAAWSTCGVYDNGDEFVVDKVDIDGDVHVNAAKSAEGAGNPDGFIARREYVVLEPLEPTEPAESATAVVGDQIRITCYECGAPKGAVGTVISVSSTGAISYRHDEKTWGASHDAYDLVGKTPESPAPTFNLDDYDQIRRKPKIGEMVLVVEATATSGKYANGDIITVTEVDGYGDPRIDGICTFDSEYVVLTPKTQKPALETRLTVGDTAIVAKSCQSYSQSNVGKLVKIVKDDHDKQPYKASIVGDKSGKTVWYFDTELRRATTSEIDGMTPRPAPTVARAYQNGDIVKVTVDTSSRNKAGTIGIVGDARGGRTDFRVIAINETSTSGAGNWHNPPSVELIVPVESRLDKAVTA